jgi:hypothetical protein
MKIELFDSPDQIHKSVSILAIVPKTGVITRVGRAAYTIMLMMAREQGSEDPKLGMFSAPVNSIIKGFDGNIGTKVKLKGHLKSMVTHVVEWQSPTSGESHDWGACGLLSEVRISSKNGSDWVYWAYPPTLREEILDPTRYATIERQTIGKFRSHAGLVLYEICARYKNNPSHLTSKREWRWWVPVLTGKPVQDDTKLEFRFFNRDTLKPAIDEVNEVSEITIELREERIGKSIEFLQFHVVRKQVQASSQIDQPIEGSALVKAELLGIPDDKAEELWSKYGNDVFLEALNKLAQRLSQITSPVRSKVAYLKAVLINRELVEETALIEAAETVVKVVPKANPAVVSQNILQVTEQNRVAMVRAEIQGLSTAARAELLKEFKDDAIQNGKHPNIVKKLDLGEWQSGLVLGELMRFFWKKTRGQDWSTEV